MDRVMKHFTEECQKLQLEELQGREALLLKHLKSKQKMESLLSM
jgi:hypothetical protein